MSYSGYQTDVTALSGGAVTLELELDRADEPHVILAVEFYSDSAGATQVEPSAGAIAFKVKTPVLPETWQGFTNGSVADLSAGNEQVSFDSNAVAVQAAVSGAGGATHCRLRAYSNRS